MISARIVGSMSRSHSNIARWALASIVSLPLLSCTSSTESVTPYSAAIVDGYVVDATNEGVSGATVRVFAVQKTGACSDNETLAGTVASGETNIEGSFKIQPHIGRVGTAYACLAMQIFTRGNTKPDTTISGIVVRMQPDAIGTRFDRANVVINLSK